MPRSLRSNTILPANFVNPIIVCDRIMSGANPPDAPAAQPQQVNVTIPLAPEIWTENPTQGDFNPGTKSGEAIFKLKTKGLPKDKRISLEWKNSAQFLHILQAKASTFGSIVTSIPVEFDAGGNVTEWGNLISKYSCISLDVLKQSAHARFATALAHGNQIPQAPWTKQGLDPTNVPNDKVTFYERVHSHVIAKWIKNMLDDVLYSNLLLKKNEFSFIDADGAESYDGLVMLKLVLTKLDPSVIVGVEVLRMKLNKCRLFQYINNIDKMCTDIEETMKQLQGLGKDCESIRRYTITSLSSGPNAKFNMFIDCIYDDIESRTGVHRDMD